jgi:hypothetical protein
MGTDHVDCTKRHIACYQYVILFLFLNLFVSCCSLVLTVCSTLSSPLDTEGQEKQKQLYAELPLKTEKPQLNIPFRGANTCII